MNEQKCRRIVKERCDDVVCEMCGGAYLGLTMHHRKKRSQGGPWSPENIVAVCGSGTTGCHGWIEHHPNTASEYGFHVRPWEDPAAVPIRRASRLGMRWQLLTQEGTVEHAKNADGDPLHPSDPPSLARHGL